MRKLLVFFSMVAIAAVLSVNLTSCGEDTPPVPSQPTVAFLADIDPDDGYTVNLTIQSTDATSFEWTYGDGETSTTSGDHSHTYTASGDYTISVKATGEGGSTTDSESVSIAASIEEMIAGSGDGGKVWVLTQQEANYAGKIGGGIIDNTLPIAPEMSLIPSGVMAMFGLGDEYTDEYTFFKDGTLKIDVKNGLAIGAILYGNVTELIQKPSDDPGSLPLCAMTYANVDDGTWALSYDDLTKTVYNEFKDPEVMEDITFTFAEDDAVKVAEMKISTGAYLGFADLTYPAMPDLGLIEAVDNSFYILKEVTADEMHIAIAIAGVQDIDGVPAFMYPTFMLHLTFVPKE